MANRNYYGLRLWPTLFITEYGYGQPYLLQIRIMANPVYYRRPQSTKPRPTFDTKVRADVFCLRHRSGHLESIRIGSARTIYICIGLARTIYICIGLARTIYISIGLARTIYIYIRCTYVFLARKPPYIRSCTVCIYGSGQPCICIVTPLCIFSPCVFFL